MKVINEILKPLSTAPLQAYVDNRIQLFDVIDTILRETGPAEIYISTFSTSEEFLGQRHSSVAGLTKDTPQSVAFPRKCINFLFDYDNQSLTLFGSWSRFLSLTHRPHKDRNK